MIFSRVVGWTKACGQFDFEYGKGVGVILVFVCTWDRDTFWNVCGDASVACIECNVNLRVSHCPCWAVPSVVRRVCGVSWERMPREACGVPCL